MPKKPEHSANWGGARDGSGRPPQLKEDAKPCQFMLEGEDRDTLDRWMRTVGAQNRSAALRSILAHVREDYRLAP